jgi:hypothetical protein
VCFGYDEQSGTLADHLVFFSLGGPHRRIAGLLDLSQCPKNPLPRPVLSLGRAFIGWGAKGHFSHQKPVPSLRLGMQLISPEYELFLEGVLRS